MRACALTVRNIGTMKTLAALFFPLVAGLCHAAGFDCDRARTAQEQFVCRTPDLSLLDERLGAVYRAHVRDLSAEAAKAVQAGQRSWLAYWPRVCSMTHRRVVLDKDSVECAKGEYVRRMQLLSVRSPLPGARVYDVSSYLALQPETPGESTVAASHQLSFPQFERIAPDGPDERFFEAVNGWLRQDASKWRRDTGRDHDSSLTTRVEAVGTVVLTATDDAYFFGHGAAHGLPVSTFRHFLVPQARALRADDVFKGFAWQAFVARLAWDDLAMRHPDLAFFVKDREALRELVIDPKRWTFGREGLVLNFAPYEVASFAEGPQEVGIAWRSLVDHLTPLGFRLSREAGRTPVLAVMGAGG